MKFSASFLIILPVFNTAFSQTTNNNTSGENSPAVISQKLSVTYGVRADAVEAILYTYEAEGYGVEWRKKATAQILKNYTQSPEKQLKVDGLSEATRKKLGISDAPKITSALEWDLFARNHYLSTTGNNSPSISAKGNVDIWYGISPKALRALVTHLEKNQTDFANFETKLAEQAKKYEELKSELETYGSKEEIYRQAESLLEEGKLEEAEQLIESDYYASKRRQAYKSYVFGRAKELLLKFDEATKGYKDAIFMDNANSTYHFYYAHNENTLAHHDVAIRHYEIALGIDTLKSGNEKRVATLFNSLGLAWNSKGAFDKALGYFQKALKNAQKVQDTVFSITCLNSIGYMQKNLKQYFKGLQSLEEGLQIAAQFNQKIKQQLSLKMLKKPEEQAKIAEMKNLPLIRRMQYHKVGCLKGLEKEKEAYGLAKQLWQEGIEANDTLLLEYLRKDGYNFEK